MTNSSIIFGTPTTASSEYYSHKRLSNSLLDYIEPLVAGKEVVVRKATEQMRFGSLFHTLILEPHKFAVELCDSKHLLLLKRLKEAIFSHEINYKLSLCIKEVEYFFKIRKYDAKMKADAIHIADLHLYDIKTTNDIAKVQESIEKYNYDRQMAFYLDALNLQKATLVFVCKQSFAVETITLTESMLQQGRNKYNYLLDLLDANEHILEKLLCLTES